MTTSGGMGPAFHDLTKRLAQKIFNKKGYRYSHFINHTSRRVSFALMRGILTPILGERGRSLGEKSEENGFHNVFLNVIPHIYCKFKCRNETNIRIVYTIQQLNHKSDPAYRLKKL
jgi:hypothetical protein